MSNRIAIVWDFDRTLIPEYMQEPIFKKFKVDGGNFGRKSMHFPKKSEKNKM